jgi:membrane glycosyltransferase
MNARLMFARGIHPVHRTVFLTGALAYLSAPLWAGFLALSTWLLIAHSGEPQYFVMPHQLFPLWPSWRPEHAAALFAGVASVLFLPKILAAIAIGMRGARPYGGAARLAASVLLEMLLAALLAPVRMIFHTQFVLAALAGWKIQWKSPARADQATSLGEALRRHGVQTLLGVAWVGIVAWNAPDFLPWIAPVAAGLLLAVPLSVLTSRATAGMRARAFGLFMTPDESAPPRELIATAQYAGIARPLPRFADAVVDPDVHAAVRRAARSPSVARSAAHMPTIERALRAGPAALDRAERFALLQDASALDRLRLAATTMPVHASWHAQQAARSRATIHHFGTRDRTRTQAAIARRRQAPQQ